VFFLLVDVSVDQREKKSSMLGLAVPVPKEIPTPIHFGFLFLSRSIFFSSPLSFHNKKLLISKLPFSSKKEEKESGVKEEEEDKQKKTAEVGVRKNDLCPKKT
jgi:hypothetical protein